MVEKYADCNILMALVPIYKSVISICGRTPADTCFRLRSMLEDQHSGKPQGKGVHGCICGQTADIRQEKKHSGL